jgi:hypothetical protein
MAFFLNVFDDDFEGNLLLGDRHHIPKFVCRKNAGRGKEVVAAWNRGPYNLSGNDSDGNVKKNLKITFCLHATKNWATLQIDLTNGAASASAVTPEEVVSILNANTLFAERFNAGFGQFETDTVRRVLIRQKKPCTEFRFYIERGQAESVIGFNARAGVDELPSYFAKHTIANRFTYPDSEGRLIQLDPSGSTVDAAIINNAVDFKGTSLGYSSSTVQADYQLLRGKSGIFIFKKITVDGSNRITAIIEYPAGAQAGDFAKKTTYSYTSTNTNPDKIAEIPYVLASGDLITPP